MAKKLTKPTRLPPKVYDDMDRALQVRFKNNLIKRRDANMVEGFRLIRRTPGWKAALEDIKFKPRKEDIDNVKRMF